MTLIRRENPPNNSMQRTALRAAADAERWADNGSGLRTQSLSPIARPAPIVRDGKDPQLLGYLKVDDMVRESPHGETAHG